MITISMISISIPFECICIYSCLWTFICVLMCTHIHMSIEQECEVRRVTCDPHMLQLGYSKILSSTCLMVNVYTSIILQYVMHKFPIHHIHALNDCASMQSYMSMSTRTFATEIHMKEHSVNRHSWLYVKDAGQRVHAMDLDNWEVWRVFYFYWSKYLSS